MAGGAYGGGPSLGAPERSSNKKPTVIVLAVLVLATVAGSFLFLRGPNGPGPEDIDAAFGTPRGYRYRELPKEFLDEAQHLIDRDPEVSEHVTGWMGDRS